MVGVRKMSNDWHRADVIAALKKQEPLWQNCPDVQVIQPGRLQMH